MKAAIIGESHACNIGERPDGDLAVSVLTNDEGVNAARIHTEVLAEQKAEARGVEDCSRADHPGLGSARELQGGVGQNIDRIGRDEKNSIWVVLRNFWNDIAPDFGIRLNAVEPGLPQFLAHPRS